MHSPLGARLAATHATHSRCCFQRVCRPGGTILLLEHGRSGYFSWLNDVLDKSAPDHAAKWGCWWNKDIPALLEASGLQLLSYHTWHFGGLSAAYRSSPGWHSLSESGQRKRASVAWGPFRFLASHGSRPNPWCGVLNGAYIFVCATPRRNHALRRGKTPKDGTRAVWGSLKP